MTRNEHSRLLSRWISTGIVILFALTVWGSFMGTAKTAVFNDLVQLTNVDQSDDQ